MHKAFSIIHSKGTYTSTNGDVFEGQYTADKRQGNGILRLASGGVYEGDWKDDYPV